MENKGKIFIIIILASLVILFTYQIYAPFSIEDFNAVNLNSINKVKRNVDDQSYSFVVLGNIKNSIGIFDEQILKKLKNQNPDFIISTGNNVVDSGEGKYRVLYRTLERMETPFITSVGENELIEEGYKNFYKYFGPFYFSFTLNNAYFIFLDTTGHSTESWQQEWLQKELEASLDYKDTFVVMNRPPLQIEAEYLLEEKTKYIESEAKRNYYQNIFAEYNVEAVFSSNLQIYHQESIQGVNYIITGGAGGELLVESPDSFYHYVTVSVSPDGINYNLHKLEGSPNIFVKALVNVWIAIQSFLFTNYLMLIIIALIFTMAGFLFYWELNREVNYYRDFQYTDENIQKKSLKIAMFTNNYFPVIGGVPISIDRLARGLRELGHEVYVFAPNYPDHQVEESEHVIRCKLLYHFKKEGMDMTIPNVYNSEIEKEFRKYNFDIVHAHHPFLLGSKGLSLGKKYDKPVVFTYHTRLEKYAHYLPGFFFIRRLFKNRVSHFMIKRFANKSDGIFAPTDSTREYLRNIGVRSMIKILPTGVDLDKYEHKEEELNKLKEKYVKEDELTFITVSRLSKEKNLYFLLDGLALIKEKLDKKFNCLVVGDGSEKENLKEYVKDKGLEDSVQFVGVVDYRDINKYYLISDLFIFASTTETQGMVLLEAMAGFTPVVAVRSSGTDDVIENGYNGYKTEEDIKDWSNKVIKLAKDQTLYEKTSQNARRTAEKHSLAKMAEQAVAMYKKVIKREEN